MLLAHQPSWSAKVRQQKKRRSKVGVNEGEYIVACCLLRARSHPNQGKTNNKRGTRSDVVEFLGWHYSSLVNGQYKRGDSFAGCRRPQASACQKPCHHRTTHHDDAFQTPLVCIAARRLRRQLSHVVLSGYACLLQSDPQSRKKHSFCCATL